MLIRGYIAELIYFISKSERFLLEMTQLTLVEISSQKAVMGSSFGPILGQYAIGIREFCNSFNLLTQKYMEGLPINLTLKSKRRDDISIENLRVSKRFLVNYYIKTLKTKSIDLNLVYILFSIDMYFLRDINIPINKKSLFKSKLAYLKSFGLKIIN